MTEIKNVLNEVGEKICVEVHEPRIFKSTIVFCHGITGCRKGRTPADNYFQLLADKLEQLGYKVILFDYSGHGDSEGQSVDVCPSKNLKELEMVIKEERADLSNVSFLAFSYGATILCKFLEKNPGVQPKKIVLYSPCLYPLESCFLNDKSIFGADIVKGVSAGEMESQGYVVVGAKGFKIGKRILEECRGFNPDYLGKFNKDILMLSGKNDVILNTKFGDDFSKKFGIKNEYLVASHSLFEQIDKAFELTINHFESK